MPTKNPNKPIKLMVPWPPGGASDVLARYVRAELGSVLTQIEHRKSIELRR